MAKSTLVCFEGEECVAVFVNRAFLSQGYDLAMRVLPDGRVDLAYVAGEPPSQDRLQSPFASLASLDAAVPTVSDFEELRSLGQQKKRKA